MIKLILTFDYELFLGKRSGTVDNCLIIPTNHLLELFSKYNIQTLFFIDTVYLMRMELLSNTEARVKNDFRKIRNQLVEIVKQGHYVFHHIHPHWLDAKYMKSENQWDLSDTSKLTFDKISEEEQNRIMSYSDSFLNEIYKEASSDKKPFGYRAGGLFIQPFIKIKPFFEKYNIKYEFSVVPETKRNDEINSFDFSVSPKERPYSFMNDVGFEMKEGDFVEFPISSIEIKNTAKILNGLYYRIMKKRKEMKPFGDGLSISSTINMKKNQQKDYFRMKIPSSVEILNPCLLSLYKNKIKTSDYFQILSHPKLISPMSLKQLDVYLKYVSNKHCLTPLSEIFK
jgi:hypothetical protein